MFVTLCVEKIITFSNDENSYILLLLLNLFFFFHIALNVSKNSIPNNKCSLIKLATLYFYIE